MSDVATRPTPSPDQFPMVPLVPRDARDAITHALAKVRALTLQEAK